MARLTLPVNTLFGRYIITGTQMAIGSRDHWERIKAIADEITAGGTNKAALETAPEVIGTGSPRAAGDGAIIYDGIVTMLNSLDATSGTGLAVRNFIKTFDQG